MIDQLIFEKNEISSKKGANEILSVDRLPGDASARKYFRIMTRSKEAGSYILMRMDPFTDQKENLPFLVVQKHLANSGVDVPAVLDFDPARGLILLEDLGDFTLLKRLQSVTTADVERELYEKAIDALVQLQVKASPFPGGKTSKGVSGVGIDAFQLKFDFEKLMWEVGFTIEHFYKTYLKREIAEDDLITMNHDFGTICKFLSEQPTVLTHRDYHSRNIMVSAARSIADTRFVMIDFQDARLGPQQYDLVSLLKDSYYQLEESQVIMLIDYYIARYEAGTGKGLDRSLFRYVFDMMSIQRGFKAIGSFASFLNKRNDATYLKYIGNTFENIRRQLLKYPEYSRLREVLFHYYYF